MSCVLRQFTLLLSSAFNVGYICYGKAPMFGDYEAQRHWMEITLNLPVQEWYVNSTRNDLLYWGLDYPPLTAYHSLVCGYIANIINPEWVALNKSRGFESFDHQLFMRYTVIIADIMVCIPAVVYYFLIQQHLSDNQKLVGTFLTLLFPGLILIDHGHFQYNCISLGLTVWAVSLLSLKRDLLGSIAFCLALNYKQMELYHAMPFFCYLLGTCLWYKRENRFFRLIKIGTVVIITFAVCWAPFLSSKDLVLDVLQRQFPFGRGLYEDKVANVWCSLSVIVKLKQILSTDKLVQLCLLSTAVMLLPSSIHLLFRPTLKNFKMALVNSSLVFFLFSFQVHEKSILIAAIPACLVLSENTMLCVWFLTISTFSMLPLLLKDTLLVPFISSTLLFLAVSCTLLQHFTDDKFTKSSKITPKGFWKSLLDAIIVLSITAAAVLTVCSVVVEPPSHLPDLWAVLVSFYSCAHFLIFLIYFHYLQFSVRHSEIKSPLKSEGKKKKQ